MPFYSILVWAQHFETLTKTFNSQWFVVLVCVWPINQSISNNSDNGCKGSSQSEQHISACSALLHKNVPSLIFLGMQPPADLLREGKFWVCVCIISWESVYICGVCVFYSERCRWQNMFRHTSLHWFTNRNRQTPKTPFTLSRCLHFGQIKQTETPWMWSRC